MHSLKKKTMLSFLVLVQSLSLFKGELVKELDECEN